ncbi:MAG: sugar porter family MFS transporter [Bacteroidales bacterium]|jgi:sugar porter (SP) family MFS transporter|nr:sugar porter family MFS transporter [Bacteroidales bacterium]
MKSFGYLIFLSTVAALGGFLFGYDTAVISGTIGSVSAQFGLNEVQTGWYVGCALVGSVVGVTVAGRLSDRFGRKPVLSLSAVLFSLSAAGCMLSTDETQLVVYRIIGGVGIGVASIISPLYISEIAIARYRGTLVALYQLAITTGFLGAYLVNYAILDYASAAAGAEGNRLWEMVFITENWRAMLGMETFPALLFLVAVFFIPESPRWLVIHGKDEAARSIMSRTCGVKETVQQLTELKLLVRNEVKSDWRLLLQPGFRKAVLTGVCLAMLGQFMGVNAVLYYGPTIFEQTGLSAGDSLLYQVIVGAVNVAATLLGMWLIDKIGRKKLVYWGVSGMIITLFLTGLYFIMNDAGETWSPLVLLALILVYIFSCAVSICVVIFVLLSEMYPARIRGAAMSIAGFSLWTGTYLIGQLTPWMMKNLSHAGVFWLFGVMCIPYLLIVWRLLPETTGKSLEDIERGWAGPSSESRDARRASECRDARRV